VKEVEIEVKHCPLKQSSALWQQQGLDILPTAELKP